MNSKTSLLLALTLLGRLLVPVEAAPPGSAFTYQGRLNDAGQPASGSYDLRAILFTADLGGSQVGPIVNVPSVTVADGVFTTELDFGPGAFNGESRWVELFVRRTGVAAYTRLDPRQAITPAPFAQFALTPAGPQGVQGPAGAVGAAGPKGDKGDTGLAGPQGLAGQTGPSGAVGPKGDKGATGPGGAVGPAGLQGPIGLTGATGATGPAGAKGVNWRGAWNVATAYAIGDGVAQNGASWMAKAVSTGSAPIAGSANWDLLADKGATGASGAAGPSGPMGLPGTTGAQGSVGVTGPIGAAGPQGPQGTPGSADGWSRTGNSGTTPGSQFIGTTDDKPFEIRVNGQRVLHFEPKVDAVYGIAPNVIGGSPNNVVGAGVVGATIAGGGSKLIGADAPNQALKHFATVGGGHNNTSSGDSATVGGGEQNTASSTHSTVGGGHYNTSRGDWATVGGGGGNTSSHGFSTVGGGESNVAGGNHSTVPGGENNVANGTGSFAAGRRAHVVHEGSFVWGDGTGSADSPGPYRFDVLARGGVGFYVTQGSMLVDATGNVSATSFIPTSDRNAKQDFAPVDSREILDKVSRLPIQTWAFKADALVPHIGPMAQDFHAAFGVGPDDKHIATVDADGVALAAIQGLNQKLEERLKEKDTRIAALEQSVAELKQLVGALASDKRSPQ